MTIYHPGSPRLPDTSLPSDLETERRLTKLEIKSESHSAKLTLHERAILAIAGALYVIAQDKFPLVASAIRGLLIP